MIELFVIFGLLTFLNTTLPVLILDESPAGKSPTNSDPAPVDTASKPFPAGMASHE